MADFVDGFVYECDVPKDGMLTIEGVKVDGFERTANGFRARLPHNCELITEETVAKLVKRYLELTGISAARAACREKHLEKLRSARDAWNNWRREEPTVQPMLANVAAKDEFPHVCLDGYNFSYANLTEAKLSGVSLKGANFHQAILAKTDLSGAHLEGANFCRTDLYMTNFTGAHLEDANLQGVQLTKTIFSGANVDRCNIYGMSAWDLQLNGASQQNFIIRYLPVGEKEERTERVDGLDLAAFMYLTVSNENIARIIDAASRKWVLILGRFTQGREVLNAIACCVREADLIPVIFDFDRPRYRDLIETVLLLAGMSAFVVVDLSDPKSTPLELHAIATNYGIPIFPIVKEGSDGFSLFAPLRRFRWVFERMYYKDVDDLKNLLRVQVIGRAKGEIDRLADLKRAVEEPRPARERGQ